MLQLTINGIEKKFLVSLFYTLHFVPLFLLLTLKMFLFTENVESSLIHFIRCFYFEMSPLIRTESQLTIIMDKIFEKISSFQVK